MSTEVELSEETTSIEPREEGELPQDAKHPLEHRWTLWYDPGSTARNNAAQWGGTLRSVYTFDSVEDFWCLYNNIKQPSGLAAGADFHLFKAGIEPKWEDPTCAHGGKWTVNITKGSKQLLDQYWLQALMACIGEHFTEGEDICGIVAHIRTKGDRLSIWTKTASDEAIQVSLAKQLKSILDLDPGARLGYLTHEEPRSWGFSNACEQQQ